MFALNALTALPKLLSGREWTLLTCASFEERWLGLIDQLRGKGVVPSSGCVLFPHDNGSRWELECTAKQEDLWSRFTKENVWPVDRVDFGLLNSPAWELAVSVVRRLQETTAGGFQCLVIDISTMPKLCFFPAIRAALESPALTTLIVTYTQPDSYSTELLHSEPSRSTLIPGFDHLDGSRDHRTGWIPILGFSSSFASTVYDSLVESYNLEHRVFPLVGFPAYEPALFERAMRDGGHSILRQLMGPGGAANHFLYSAASDPFETKKTILRLMDGTTGVQWIGSPLGPKPMALGMLLASLERKLSIVTCQARSYHPEYSTGVGSTHAYVLKSSDSS